MKYPHAVIYNGKYYPAHTEIAEYDGDQKNSDKEDTPKVQKSKKKGGAE